MLKVFFVFFILATLGSDFASGQCNPHAVPGGTIYKITLRDSAFNLDHANYSLFIPEGSSPLRGIFIHQHGCTAEGTGEATAYDLQYQAFARKWNLAILGPDLYPHSNSGCGDWINPEEGSGPALLHGLDALAKCSKRTELPELPWILWGHSGGGYWVLALTKNFPERTIATFCYSPAFDPGFKFSSAATKIPIMIRHAGRNDFNDPGVNCWGTALHTFEGLRQKDGLISVAFTPNQNHNFSYTRYMAIPFFESVLAQRLPSDGSRTLKDMDQHKAWYGDTTTRGKVEVYKSKNFVGDKSSMSWLPDSLCAIRYREYVMTGSVKDVTKPSPPDGLVLKQSGSSIILSWQANADIESGIQFFNIYKNTTLLGRYPESRDFQSFDSNTDNAIPIFPPELKYTIQNLNPDDTVAVTTVNRFNLESDKAKLVWRAR